MLSELCRTCNVNFAALCDTREVCLRHKLEIFLCKHKREAINILDILLLAAYFILHTYLAKCRLAETRSQARTSQPPRRSQSTSRARARPPIRRGRVLRCPRSGPDQIRDAAPGTGRARLQSQGRRSVRYVAPDALSGRGGTRARRPGRPVAQAARPQGGAQAQRQSHGLYREAPTQRRIDACAGPGAGDRISARAIGSSTQYRTRARAQKKTVAESTPEWLPQAAAASYEALRAEVISGKTRPAGVAALRFHGMAQGLALLLNNPAPSGAPAPKVESSKPMQRDNEFIRVLANIVLRTHSELTHVY